MKVTAVHQLYFMILLLLLNLRRSICTSYIVSGYEVSMAVPADYGGEGFVGRAFLIQTEHLMPPNFRAALTVESSTPQGNLSCSLQLFLGDVKVWSSGHSSRFFTPDRCSLQLTGDGDLRLLGPTGHVGWRTGTSGQGVQKLRILRSGNLALVDDKEGIKWQSFNFPTDVMLLGQSLNVATHLTSFPPNSTSFYSFEIQTQRIALYLNTPNTKYSYWEFKSPNNTNLSFITLNAQGLDMYDDNASKIATIPSETGQPLRFLALGNRTGNMGLYSYAPEKGIFDVAFRALKTTCDLPLACKAYGICTGSETCSCIRIQGEDLECGGEDVGGFCGGEMVELEGVSSGLRADGDKGKRVNVGSKEECGKCCLEDCECLAAMYYYWERECYLYRVVSGVREIDRAMGLGLSYMVKVRKGPEFELRKRSLKKWVFAVVGVVDGLVIVAVCAGLAYYFINSRTNNLINTNNNNTNS